MSSTAKHSPVVVTASEISPLLHGDPTTSPDAIKHETPGSGSGSGSGSRVKHSMGHMPQSIAHRGFSKVAPENSMAAFKAAVAAGTDAIETDLHLTRDNVLVLSHDPSLQRCFGIKKKVRDLDWSEISQLWTVQQPRQRMLRLVDLLEYLDQPGLEHIWIMLDIKTDDDAQLMMRRIAETLASVPGKQRPWSTRVTPCCWDATYIKLSLEFLRDYAPTHLGFSTTYARCLTDIPNISFSMLRHSLASPLGARFLRDMQALGIPVYVWTLNDEGWMEWAIQKHLSGVITDNVELFNEVRGDTCQSEGSTLATWQRKASGLDSWSFSGTLKFWGEMTLVHLLITCYMTVQWVKHGSVSYRVNKALNR
ncbi:PLC-like phosphodiesterase [Xylaria nigripes]|nr:PLC-like phosphodiesterase [Xylaria nigripes]